VYRVELVGGLRMVKVVEWDDTDEYYRGCNGEVWYIDATDITTFQAWARALNETSLLVIAYDILRLDYDDRFYVDSAVVFADRAITIVDILGRNVTVQPPGIYIIQGGTVLRLDVQTRQIQANKTQQQPSQPGNQQSQRVYRWWLCCNYMSGVCRYELYAQVGFIVTQWVGPLTSVTVEAGKCRLYEMTEDELRQRLGPVNQHVLNRLVWRLYPADNPEKWRDVWAMQGYPDPGTTYNVGGVPNTGGGNATSGTSGVADVRGGLLTPSTIKLLILGGFALVILFALLNFATRRR